MTTRPDMPARHVQAKGDDAGATAATLLALARLLARLHGDGLCHRDLRPGSFRWLPQRLAWALVNFGFSAKAGAHGARFFCLLGRSLQVVLVIYEWQASDSRLCIVGTIEIAGT